MGSVKRGDEVLLFIGGDNVASGTIIKTHYDDTIQYVRVGEGRLGVLIEKCVEGNESVQIPYPSTKSRTLDDALDSCVLWDISDACVANNVPSTPVNVLDEGHLHPLSEGDEVDMYLLGSLVAKGIVFKTDPRDTYHNEELGIGRISIQVIEILLGWQKLPYPNAGAQLISEAKASWVIWDLANVLRKSTMPGPSQRQDSPHDIPQEYHSKDFTQRSNWLGEEVQLYDESRLIIVASGVLTLPSEQGVVNGELLGLDHVGIAVVTILQPTFFPDLSPGVAALVKWSIMSIFLVSPKRFVGDIVQEATENPMSRGYLGIDQGHDSWPQTRPYNYFKRTKFDPKARRRQHLHSKAVSKSSEASIDAIRRQECCRSKYCLHMPREELEAIRLEFHGMSSENKTTHIFSLFHCRDDAVKKNGWFILAGRILCKQAFTTIHGFSTAKYYQYKNDYEAGCRVGVHGNKGMQKPRSNTLHARALLHAFLVSTGESMPHFPYSGRNGTNTIEYRLPSCYTKPQIFKELTTQLEGDGYDTISDPTFYKIWNDSFANYSIHRSGAFAKCTLCIEFRDLLMREKRKKERAEIEARRGFHLREQMSRRYVYYAHKILAKNDPDNYLCIIHDKMDQAKTYIPRMNQLPKSLSNIGQALPIALTGMLTHGRNPGAFAHFSVIGLWPGDPDFTITSLAKCLRDLEDYVGDKSEDILPTPSWSATRPFFQSLLDYDAFLAGYLEPKKISMERFQGHSDSQEVRPEMNANAMQGSFKPLPRHLTLQLDNSTKDNKNQYVMGFLSDLVSRGIFDTIQMSFLIKGHTHEDVDALFSRISNHIKHKEVATLLALMAEVWESEKINPVPSLIQEVTGYKEYLKTFQMKEIEGHSKPQAFLFSMKNNVPIYQYRTDVSKPWMPPNGRCIWSTDPVTQELILPTGQPYAKPVTSGLLNKSQEVILFLHRYMDFLRNSCKDETSATYRERFPVLQYWEKIAEHLSKDLTIEGENGGRLHLASRFWPKTNHGTSYKVIQDEASEPSTTLNAEMMALQNEYMEEMEDQALPFLGRPQERESKRWIPLSDIEEGHFMFLRPEND